MQYAKIGRNLYRPIAAYQKPNIRLVQGAEKAPEKRTFVTYTNTDAYEIMNIGIHKSRIDIRI